MFSTILKHSFPFRTIFIHYSPLPVHLSLFERTRVCEICCLKGTLSVKKATLNIPRLLFRFRLKATHSFWQIVRIVAFENVAIFPNTATGSFFHIIFPLSLEPESWQLHSSKTMLEIISKFTFEVVFGVGKRNFSLAMLQTLAVAAFVT